MVDRQYLALEEECTPGLWLRKTRWNPGSTGNFYKAVFYRPKSLDPYLGSRLWNPRGANLLRLCSFSGSETFSSPQFFNL